MQALFQAIIYFLQYVLIFYLILVILFYILSDFIIFQPPTPPMYKKSDAIKMVELPNGGEIATLYIKNPNALYTILYSHGNAEDLGTAQPFLYYLAQQGYSVLAYDYEGYGLSSGKPSEKGTYKSIRAAYHYLIETLKTEPKHIILFGSSLGSGPSVDLASEATIGGLILQSPFASAYRVKTHIPLIPFDKFVSINKINKVKAPVLIIHGQRDRIIPFWHGKKLYDAANEPKTFVPVENGDHNNLINFAGPLFWQSIHQFTESLSNE